MESEFGDVTINDIEKDFTVGVNFGIGVNFNKIGIDLRYERGFSENEAEFATPALGGSTTFNSKIDTRPEQLILSLSLMF